MEAVCDSIYASLEGTKRWTAAWHENKADQEAYINAFTRCQAIVKNHDLEPEQMLLALDTYHDEVVRRPIKPPFFSFARWVGNPAAAEEQAVRTAFQVIESARNRFL